MIKIGVTGDFFEMEKEIRLLKAIPEFNLSGIYHYNTKLLKEFSNKHNLPRFSSSSSLIEESDAIDLAGNNEDKSHLCAGILKNSKHLIIDFPGVTSTNHFRQLTKLASEAEVIMQVRNPYRFNPAYMACISQINKPAVIELKMDIRQEDKLDDKSVLCIDLIRDMIRSNTYKVNATGISVGGSKTDYLTARIEFDNGSIANISVNQLSGKDSVIANIYQPGNQILINFSETRCSIEKIPFSLFPDNNADNSEKIFPEIEEVIPAHEELKQFENAIMRKYSSGIDIERALQSIDIFREMVEKINKTTFHPLQN